LKIWRKEGGHVNKKKVVTIVLFVAVLLILILVYVCVAQADRPVRRKAEQKVTESVETLSSVTETVETQEQVSETQSKELEEIQVTQADTLRVSATEIRVTWTPPEQAQEVIGYLLKRCSLVKGKENGSWETVAEVPSESIGEDGRFVVTDTLSSAEPQQFAYRVDVEVTDETRFAGVDGTEVLASNLMICIDPGHYANGTHITGEDSYNYVEGVFTLQIGLALKEILKEEYGIDSYLTRETGVITLGGYTDRNLDRGHITLRGEYAKEKDSTLFISLHTNANQDNANGYPTCLQPEKITKAIVFVNRIGCNSRTTIDVANQIGVYLTKTNAQMELSTVHEFQTVDANSIGTWTDAYNDSLDTSGTVCKRMDGSEDYYGVLRGSANVDIPGLIVEHGFHTVAKMRRLAAEGDLAEMWAQADADGIATGYGFRE
jgi:N-acetylmuramoyl-L-alanine amidase